MEARKVPVLPMVKLMPSMLKVALRHFLNPCFLDCGCVMVHVSALCRGLRTMADGSPWRTLMQTAVALATPQDHPPEQPSHPPLSRPVSVRMLTGCSLLSQVHQPLVLRPSQLLVQLQLQVSSSQRAATCLGRKEQVSAAPPAQTVNLKVSLHTKERQ